MKITIMKLIVTTVAIRKSKKINRKLNKQENEYPHMGVLKGKLIITKEEKENEIKTNIVSK